MKSSRGARSSSPTRWGFATSTCSTIRPRERSGRASLRDSPLLHVLRAMSHDLSALLARLDLKAQNPGACAGPQAWRGQGPSLAVKSPSDETLIAEVATATSEDYDAVLASTVAAANAWREVPAPKRGEAVRRLGLALREHKDALGSLIALENGKIK